MHTVKKYLSLILLSLFSLEAVAIIPITLQGVVRDSSGDLVMLHTPVGGIRVAFYHATYCNSPVNGDATFTGCAPSGGAGSEVINPFTIVVGAFSVTITPSSNTLADMAESSSGWYVKLKGEFSPGAPVGEFLIPVNSVPFSNLAATSASVANTEASGNSIISAINSTASTDTKIDADRLNIDGGSITTGTIGGNTVINTSGTISGSNLISSSGTAAQAGVQVGANQGTGLFSSAANKLDFTTNGVQRMSLDANGNLGLGQSTPTAKLDIDDTTLSGSGSLAGSILNLTQTWNTSGTPTAFKLNVTDTASNLASLLMDLQVGGSSKFAVRKNGNVGIGTSSPTTTLHLSVNGPGGGLVDRYSDNPFSNEWVIRKARGTSDLPTTVVSADELGGLEFYGYDGLNFRGSATVRSYADGAVSPGILPGRLSFFINSGSQAGYGTEAMTIKSSGNVGIGTTSPAEKLDISGGNIVVDNTFGYKARLTDGSRANMMRYNSSNNAVIGPNDEIRLSGSVFIEPPSGGSITIQGGSANSATAVGTVMRTRNFFTTSGAKIVSFRNSLDEKSYIDKDGGAYFAGNVGIGTTAPDGNLEVKSETVPTVQISNGNNSNNLANGAVLGNLSFSGYFNNSSNDLARIKGVYSGNGITRRGDLVFETHNSGYSEKMRISSSGNIGIGTSTPAAPLHIRGSFLAREVTEINTSARGVEIIPSTYNGQHIIRGHANSGGGLNLLGFSTGIGQDTIKIKLDPTGYISFGTHASTEASERMRIDSNGNVGIGTISPSYRLHVVGSSGSTVGYFSDGAQSCSIIPAIAGNISCSSDERLKQKIKTFSDAISLENILKLQTVTYEWKSVANGRHTGYIAQDVEKIAPEFVTTGKDGHKQVSYTGFIPWITGAIKELHSKFLRQEKELENQRRQIKAEIEALRNKSEKLEVENAKMKAENTAIKAYLCSKDPKSGFCR